MNAQFINVNIEPNVNTMMLGVLGVLLCVGLLISVYLASKRLQGNKARFAFVSVLNIIAFTTFLSLFFNISYQYDVQRDLKIYTDTSGIYLWDKNLSKKGGTRISLTELSHKLTQYRALVLHGNGLSDNQWHQLSALMDAEVFNNLNIEYSEVTPIPLGFERVIWPRQLVIGDSLDVQLKLSGPKDIDQIFSVYFYDPYQTLIDVQQAKIGDFLTFSSIPASQGNWLYQVEIFDQQDNLLASENIGVEVTVGTNAKVLIVQSAPSFETRHLHNWLANNGSQVRVHSQISKNKFKQQIINPVQASPTDAKQMLWQENLSWADVMVADNRFISQLSDSEVSAMHTAIREGLGLYIIANTRFVQDKLPLVLTPLIDQLQFKDGYLEKALFSWEEIKTNEPIKVLNARFKTQSIINDENDNGLVSVFDYEKGKLAISMSQYTHTWRLAGKPQLHSQYWQKILQAIGKPQAMPKVHWQNADLLDTSQAQKTLCFDNINEQSQLSIVTPSGIEKVLHLAADSFFENRKCSTFIGDTAGWYEVRISASDDSDYSESSISLYVDDKTSWQTLNLLKQISATKKRSEITNSKEKILNQKNIPHTLSYLILLLILAALWIEQRWFANQSS